MVILSFNSSNSSLGFNTHNSEQYFMEIPALTSKNVDEKNNHWNTVQELIKTPQTEGYTLKRAQQKQQELYFPCFATYLFSFLNVDNTLVLLLTHGEVFIMQKTHAYS